MTIEDLVKMGFSEEEATSVLPKLDGNFVPKSRFNEVNTELKNSKAQVETLNSQIEDLKKANPEELTSRIEQLQEENKTLGEKHASELEQVKLDSALDMAIIGAKGKNAKAIKALIDPSKIALKDGKLEGLDLDELKKSYDYLFDVETTKEPTFFGAAPAGNSTNPTSGDSVEQSIKDIFRGI